MSARSPLISVGSGCSGWNCGLVARRLDDVRETTALALVWRPRANPALTTFVERARRAVEPAAA